MSLLLHTRATSMLLPAFARSGSYAAHDMSTISTGERASAEGKKKKVWSVEFPRGAELSEQG